MSPIPAAYLTALSFLTRLAPPRTAADLDLSACLPWFPLAGLTLAAPLVALALPPPLAARPWVAAWLVLAANIWLTRGLHYDGVADLSDAWGSGARGDRFYAILKDSRLGAFGAMGLFLAAGGQLVLFQDLLAQGRPLAVGFAVVFGRFAAVAMAAAGRHLARPGLAAPFLAGADGLALALAAMQTLPLGVVVLGPAALGAAGALLLPALLGLRRLAARAGGLNGDFLGAAVVLGELCACLAAALVAP